MYMQSIAVRSAYFDQSDVRIMSETDVHSLSITLFTTLPLVTLATLPSAFIGLPSAFARFYALSKA